jgi:hypothetical protein
MEVGSIFKHESGYGISTGDGLAVFMVPTAKSAFQKYEISPGKLPEGSAPHTGFIDPLAQSFAASLTSLLKAGKTNV